MTHKENVMREEKKIPKALGTFMYALMEEARRYSFMEFCNNWGIDYDTDYKEIEQWFNNFGIEL